MRVVILLCLLQLRAHAQIYSWYGSGPILTEAEENECTADRSSCSCCFMLQEIHGLKWYFNKTLHKVEEAWQEANESLNQIITNRVAFSVALFDHNRFMCFGPKNIDTLIPYQQVFLNLGGGYDPLSGTFSAPRSGVYSLALTIHSDAGAPGSQLVACARLQHNGRLVAKAKEKNFQDQEDSSTVIVVLHLQAGDHVDVLLSAGCFLCDDSSHFNTFSAFLLYGE